MRRLRAMSLLAAFFTGLLVAAAEEHPTIPLRFEFKFGGGVIWVAASEAITSDGIVRPGILRSAAREDLEYRRKHQADGRARSAMTAAVDCDVAFFGAIVDNFENTPVSTLAELRSKASSRRVVSGVVTACAVGLHTGMPHLVLRVNTDSRGSRDVVYLLYPAGRVHFDGMTVCNADPAYSGTPAIGDAITFVAPEPIDASDTLFTVPGSWIFYDHQGALVRPPGLRADAETQRIRSAREVADYLRMK